MAKKFLKNTGSRLIALSLVLCAVSASAAVVGTSLERTVIAAGESTELAVTVDSGGDIEVEDIPEVNGLRIGYAYTGRSFQFFNGRTSSTQTVYFNVYGEREGTYTIPSFAITAGGVRFNTKPVSITVKNGAAEEDGRKSTAVLCDVEVSSDSVYTGQPLIMRYYIYHENGTDVSVDRISEPPVSKGFLVKMITEKSAPAYVMKNGVSMIKELVVSYCLIPEIPGDSMAGGGSIYLTLEQGSGFFSMPVQSEARFPEKRIRTKPVPARGKPAGYSGDVGEFRIEALLKSGACSVNEEIQVPVTVSGRGNFLLMSKPGFENTDGIRVLVEESEPELSLSGSEISGTKKFLVTVIPLKEGRLDPGRLKFTFFNPYSGGYVVASSEPLSLEVNSVISPSSDRKDNKNEEEGGLSVFAYIAAGALLMAAITAAGFLFIREKRRYSALRVESDKRKDRIQQEERPDPVKLIRDELEYAHAAAGHDRLLSACYRAMDLINGMAPEKDSDELSIVKQKLDAARYANAALSDEELGEVYKTLMNLLK